MKIEINRTNEQQIVAELNKAAVPATVATIPDWNAFETALKSVLLDIDRRFGVPDDVDMRALFSAASRWGETTELTFRRANGVWYFEKARSKRTPCRINWVRYSVGPYAYEKFLIYVRDGRSMRSVDLNFDEPVSAHERLAIFNLQANHSKLRALAKRKA